MIATTLKDGENKANYVMIMQVTRNKNVRIETEIAFSEVSSSHKLQMPKSYYRPLNNSYEIYRLNSYTSYQ